MNKIHITLAVEDLLSEVVVRKLLTQADRNYQVTQCLCKGGSGYLKSKMNAFNQAAKASPFFVLTDQDRGCPPDKIARWMVQECHPNMIFRIAVMEVESWVMAHRDAFSEFLLVPLEKIPKNMDAIADPKKLLVSLARRSRSRRLRADITPPNGSTSKQGPDYNNRLAQFVRDHWDVHQAQRNSESLNRAFLSLQKFKPVFQ